MDRNRISQQITGAIFILLLLTGCGAPVAEPTPEPPANTPIPPPATKPPIPPTDTPTSVPPTATPPVLVTNIEMLIGNWQPLSKGHEAMFLQINSDGTCRQSYLLDGLTNIPEVECTYTFEGANISLTMVKLNGVPDCPTPTGSYEVRLVADGQIELVAKKDSCAPRIRSTRGEYQRIP